MEKIEKKASQRKRFLRQYSIEKYVVDFYCPEIKLAVELDGNIHNLKEEIERDKIRQDDIEKYRITFLRFKNEEVIERIDEVVLIIEKRIDKLRGTGGGV